ncbi:PAS-domain containing protein [Roseicyclus persicicus]|uniref:PAS domain-containing protein n=1 Tax=Roseicyclus persicicus TaxID=2650661 RepID=A0A7X6H1V2_9RHOB|nr:PAS-domain containing protein [Roseibacterium persicicum]NKX45281.1 PAS domain-containing protein [Roseibacterium persicicum]
MPDLYTVVFFAGVSLFSAALGLALSARLETRAGRRRGAGPVFADAPRRYEFREGYLLSPVDPNDAFLPDGTDRSAAFEALIEALRPLNPDLAPRMAALARRGEPFLLSGSFGQDALTLAGRAEGDRLIVTVGPSASATGREVVDGAALAALRAEAEDLRAALDAAPAAMWRQGPDGRILWANAPYFALVDRLGGAGGRGVAWPPPPLFAGQVDPLPDAGTLRRCTLSSPAAGADAALSFEVAGLRQPGGDALCTALPADRLVAAETALRSFVQTLSKTFAQLPIGLAVFDRRRELMLFNPALVALSTLPPDFLSSRPTLVAFLDALRDRQRAPEPRNYRAWRDEIARLERGAEDGTYQELWSLPSGQSFRVIGRPHPDGALAIMFEDITPEMTLTRRFRGDLDLYRAALDALPEAVAVVSDEGRLVFANAACAALWDLPAAGTGDAPPLAALIADWEARCRPTGLWDALRRAAAGTARRAGWSGEVCLNAGRRLSATVTPLPGGALSLVLRAPDEAGLPAVAFAEPQARFRSRRATED